MTERLIIFVVIVSGLAFISYAIVTDSRDSDMWETICRAAGGDKVTLNGQFSDPRRSCWNTKTGQQIFTKEVQ